MSITKPVDGWDTNAARLLRRQIAFGSAIDYAPDSRYDADKRATVVGPLTIQITDILRHHADLWAHDMREQEKLGMALDGQLTWVTHMRDAHAEIARFVASHRLGTGAAA